MSDRLVMDKVELFEEIDRLLSWELAVNPVSYNKDGRPYQSYERIGLEGLRWSVEERFRDLGIHRWINKGDRILDIGCNTGFTSVELAKRYGCTVTGVDHNKILLDVGRVVSSYVGVDDKVVFIHGCFNKVRGSLEKFDVVLCLACFHTQDGMEREDASVFFNHVFSLLDVGGRIVFESVSFNKWTDNFHLRSAIAAVDVCRELFKEVFFVEKPSGSVGWYRSFFVGEKKNV